MDIKIIFFILFFVWSFPVWKYRSDFRKMAYGTNDWKINIQPYFFIELKVLFGFSKRESESDKKAIYFYRFYLVIYFILFGLFIAL